MGEGALAPLQKLLLELDAARLLKVSKAGVGGDCAFVFVVYGNTCVAVYRGARMRFLTWLRGRWRCFRSCCWGCTQPGRSRSA